MLQKISTIVKKYVHIDYKKTIDIIICLWYYIVKERETENLKNQSSSTKQVADE